MTMFMRGAVIVLLTILAGCGESDAPKPDDGRPSAEKRGNLRPDGMPDAAGDKNPLTRYVTEETFAVAVFQPQAIMKSKLMALFPVVDDTEDFQPTNYGTIGTTKQMVIVISRGPKYAAQSLTVNQFTHDIDPHADAQALFPPLEPDQFPWDPFQFNLLELFQPDSVAFEEVDPGDARPPMTESDVKQLPPIDGKPAFESKAWESMTWYPHSDTRVSAPLELRSVLAGNGTGRGAMLAELESIDHGKMVSIVLAAEPLRDLLRKFADEARPALAAEFQGHTKLADTVQAATISLDSDAEPAFTLTLRGTNEQVAREIESQVQLALEAAKKAVPKTLKSEYLSYTGEQVLRLVDTILPAVTVNRDGDRVVVAAPLSESLLALPAKVSEMREYGLMRPKTRSEYALRMLTFAFQDYEAVHRALPAAAYTKDGEPLLSWRVALLPYLEQDVIFNKYNLQEPWDSPTNKPLSASRLPFYGEGTKTRFKVLTGPGTLFDGRKRAIEEIKDGARNTILVVQVAPEYAVEWASPADIKFDPDNPLAGIGPIPDEGLLVGMVDGRVVRLPKTITPEEFKGLVTPAGGEPPYDFPED